MSGPRVPGIPEIACPECRGSGLGRKVEGVQLACDLCNGTKTVHPAMVNALRAVDPIARLARAWDMDGRHCFARGGLEHQALLALAYLPDELEKRKWCDLTAEQRRRLMIAARLAVEFGRACAWVFGEGR